MSEVTPNQLHLISSQRRLGDHAFSNARAWLEIQQAHRTWWTNYNSEHHYAHRERQDGLCRPSDVLGGVLGRTYPEEVLSRLLYATQFTRHLDKYGYVNFKNWRFFDEDGLSDKHGSVRMYEGMLRIEYRARHSQCTSSLSRPYHKHNIVPLARQLLLPEFGATG